MSDSATPDPRSYPHCAGCGHELRRVGEVDGWVSAINSGVWCPATFGTHEPYDHDVEAPFDDNEF